MLSKRGFTLVECLVVVAIVGIVAASFAPFLARIAALHGRLVRAERQAASTLAELQSFKLERVAVVELPSGACKAVEDGFFAAPEPGRVVKLFRSADCSGGSIGTLDALSNESYFHGPTGSQWFVSGEQASLKLIIVKYLQ